MPSGRFILRYRGAGQAPEGDLDRIRAVPGAEVVDQSARMLLVEGPVDPLKALVDSMPEWIMTTERMVPLPDARPKIRRGPRED